MHPSGVHGGLPSGYYGHSHGMFRHPSYQVSHNSNPSFQSMTAHWNMSGPVSHTSPAPPATAAPSASSRSKHHHSNLQIPPPPKPPDRPLLPYMRYSRKTWEQLKADGKRVYESSNIAQVGRLIGQKWRELTEEEKQPYHDEYEAEKAIYTEQMKIYRSSPAYKRWLELKQQAEQASREAAAAQQAASVAAAAASQPFHEYGPPPPSIIAPSRHSIDSRLQLMQQQQHDDEDDEYMTMKQVAAVRFHRNHRLMMEVFSDVCVPDPRTVVSKNRLAILMKQVQSLESHKRRLDEEMKQLESKFELKKRQSLANSVKFRRELKRIHGNPPTTWKTTPSVMNAKDIPTPSSDTKYAKL